MNSRTTARAVRGWDIGLAAAILAVVLLGWLTAPGHNGGARHSGRPVGPARLSGGAGPGGEVTGTVHIAPRPRGGNGSTPTSTKGTPK